MGNAKMWQVKPVRLASKQLLDNHLRNNVKLPLIPMTLPVLVGLVAVRREDGCPIKS